MNIFFIICLLLVLKHANLSSKQLSQQTQKYYYKKCNLSILVDIFLVNVKDKLFFTVTYNNAL